MFYMNWWSRHRAGVYGKGDTPNKYIATIMQDFFCIDDNENL